MVHGLRKAAELVFPLQVTDAPQGGHGGDDRYFFALDQFLFGQVHRQVRGEAFRKHQTVGLLRTAAEERPGIAVRARFVPDDQGYFALGEEVLDIFDPLIHCTLRFSGNRLLFGTARKVPGRVSARRYR